jgi:hypothetical protein
MSLATTTDRLEHSFRFAASRNPPWQRWAAVHRALRIPPDEIRGRLADRDRVRSGPILAALVDLARHGDREAALLVTLALLPRMVRVEQRARCRDGGDGYEQLAGILWEAVVTAPNPNARCLRESIERNVWRRKWRSERPAPTLPLDPDAAGRAIQAGDDTEAAAVGHTHLQATVQRLEAAGSITASTRRLLEHLAADTEPPAPAGQSWDAARKQRWRSLGRVRRLRGLREALTA